MSNVTLPARIQQAESKFEDKEWRRPVKLFLPESDRNEYEAVLAMKRTYRTWGFGEPLPEDSTICGYVPTFEGDEIRFE